MERYELTSLALLEEHFPAHLAYGRWDWVFGCWLAESRNGPLRPVMPTWPLLNRDGTAAGHRPRLRVAELNEDLPSPPPRLGLGRDVASKDPPLSAPAAAALNHYLTLIPAEVRSIVASMGAFQWLLLEAIHTVPGFDEFARVSLETRRAGFIAGAWCLSNAHALTAGARRQLNRAIMTTPRRQLLERLSGTPFGSIALSCIYKLDLRHLNASLIRRVLTVTNDPALRMRLSMARKLSPTLLDNIANIPERLLHPGLLDALAEVDGAECPYNVVHELKLLVEKDRGSGAASAVEALKRVRNSEGLIDAIACLKERIAARKPFPPAPVERSRSLRPLLTVAELRQEAREMQSCIRTYGPAVQARHSYICAWVGRERATVELVRGPGNRWTLGAFAGRNNRALSIGTVLEIVTTLAGDLRTKRGGAALGTKQETGKLARSPAPRRTGPS